MDCFAENGCGRALLPRARWPASAAQAVREGALRKVSWGTQGGRRTSVLGREGSRSWGEQRGCHRPGWCVHV